MNSNFIAFAFITGLAWVSACPAQSEETGTGQAAGEPSSAEESGSESAGSSSETDISEDSYRRYMELKDRNIDRASLPTAAYVKPAGLEKMENLPEASQKHLRNQLRDIILQSGPWSPEDAGKEYPYTPSEAAQGDRGLREDEAAAWTELVAEYHAREADIFAHSARSQAALAAGGSMAEAGGQNGASTASSQGQGGGDAGQNSSGNAGQDSNSGAVESGQAAKGSRQSDAAMSADALAENAADDGNDISSRGVSQNALEFLTGHAGSTQAGSKPEAATTEQGTDTGDQSRENTAIEDTVAQNAQASTEASDRADSSEQASGETGQQDQSSGLVFISPGTISIKDLDNVRGVIVPPPPDPDDGSQEEEKEN